MSNTEESEVAKKVKSLLEKEEEVKARAVAQTMKKYHENPTHLNLKNWDAAKRAYEEFQSLKAAEAKPGERRFANLTEILGYLTGEGWKISKTKLYDDANKIDKEKDGTILVSSADRYAKLVSLPRIDGSAQDTAEWVKKEQLNNEILEERKKKLQRENEIEEGKWVLKSEVEQKHTTKLALLLTAVDNYIHGGKLEEGIELVNGDKARAAEFKEHIKKGFRAALAEYAKRPEFTVPKQAVIEAETMIEEVESE